ncbi:hypothetical protein [Psychroflexus halocasei]|uniref:Cell division protease FtsH n=1 Tax=Psychroflexus halocasei TaxID=908615 RepID=A0A1H3VEC7_9FLAO|nr:hypothetical protein [Psychroflexus halocasei]SDZ73146.1 cell division protease FtsH [Psychroflexus halocasei]
MNLKELRIKQNNLRDIETQLKQEFYGLDDIINQLINTIGPWYLFNEAQTHPLIINLWGLTGTGKTSLVKKIVHLLDKDQAFFRFEMDNIKNKDIDTALTNAVDVYEGDDYIICLDEFQHLRTIDQAGSEIKNDLDFNLWDFLDTGEFEHISPYYDKNDYLLQYNNLKVWISNGFKLRDGRIFFEDQPEHLKIYLKKRYQKKNENSVEYLLRDQRHDLFKLFKDQFDNILDFEKYYYNSNEKELLNLIYRASKRKRNAEKGDMSKSLVFVIGNLDEAYQMSKDFNPDINADAFYQLSTRINITQIKDALKQRFRNEQIARLGNNHIMYPALNKSAYQAIISRHLDQISYKFRELYQINFVFDNSVHDMLYNNGVYPTQGVRPLLSSLKTNIDANIGQILSDQHDLEVTADQIKISYKSGYYIVDYYNSESLLKQATLSVQADLDDLREGTDINKQAVTAVHEAGHAVTSIALLNKIPAQLNSTTADQYQDGFSYDLEKLELITKDDLINIAARCLGGLEAERLIFGEDLISLGSSSDLKKATGLVLKSLYENGFGSKTGFYGIKSPRNKYQLSEAVPDLQIEAETLIREAEKIAKNCLTQEKVLLLKLSKYLSDNHTIDKQKIKTFIQNYGSHINLDQIEKNQNKQDHLKLLKQSWRSIPKEFLDVDERLILNIKKVLIS